MKKAKHTAPPWTAQCDKPSAKNPMALVTTSACDERCVAIDCTGSGKTYAEDCANAHAIAAVPEMHQALHDIAFGLQTAAEMRERARAFFTVRRRKAPKKKRPAVPKDFPVQPLKPGEHAKDKVTCGECGRSWDDAKPTEWTPAPGGRCPFEYFH